MIVETEDPGPEVVEAARYIADMARELRALPGKADLGFLAYLLSMVEDDATATYRRLVDDKPDL